MKWVDLPRPSLALATAPSCEPVSYADLKTWMRLPDDTDEALVTSLAAAARAKVEEDTSRRLITQAWDLTFDAFPSDAILVPIEPLIAVTSIKTTTAAGVQSTLASTQYQVNVATSPPSITLADAGTWPSDLRAHQGIVVRLSVGYGTAPSAVPDPLKQAILQLVTMWYGTARGGGTIVAPRWVGYDAVIQPYRLPGLA